MQKQEKEVLDLYDRKLISFFPPPDSSSNPPELQKLLQTDSFDDILKQLNENIDSIHLNESDLILEFLNTIQYYDLNYFQLKHILHIIFKIGNFCLPSMFSIPGIMNPDCFYFYIYDIPSDIFNDIEFRTVLINAYFISSNIIFKVDCLYLGMKFKFLEEFFNNNDLIWNFIELYESISSEDIKNLRGIEKKAIFKASYECLLTRDLGIAVHLIKKDDFFKLLQEIPSQKMFLLLFDLFYEENEFFLKEISSKSALIFYNIIKDFDFKK